MDKDFSNGDRKLPNHSIEDRFPVVSVIIFTYKRTDKLLHCLRSLSLNTSISEVLIFNDDECTNLSVTDLGDTGTLFPNTAVYNPSDFGFKGRSFRKHKYLNKSIELAKEEKLFFSDDDGTFTPGVVDAHDAALDNFRFSAGAIVRSALFRHASKSILQGTNYAFQRSLLRDLGGYDEAYAASFGGGDAEFWYRIYTLLRSKNEGAAFLPKAKQVVIGKSTRRGKVGTMDPKEYTKEKHSLHFEGPMYKWFPEIRNKKKWMTVIK